MTDVKVMSVTFLLSAGRSRDRDRFSHGSDVPHDHISQNDVFCYFTSVLFVDFPLPASCGKRWKMCASTTMASLKFPLQDPLQAAATAATTTLPQFLHD